MKSILQSIKPQYCELIASGKKTIEVRKTRPKLDVPFKVYIYCTKGKLALLCDDRDTEEKYKFDYWDFAEFHQSNGMKVLGGKVIGEYVCDYITPIFSRSRFWIAEDVLSASCLSFEKISKYADGALNLYGWHISHLKIYDKPKELSEFVKCNMPSFDDLDGSEVLCDYCIMTDFGERKTFGFAAGDYYDCGGEECKEAYKSYIEDNQYLTRPPQSWCYVEEV